MNLLNRSVRSSVWHDRLRYHVIDDGKGLRLASHVHGYPIFYIKKHYRDETVCCAECATSAHQESDTTITEADANWEHPELYCDCGERIESAYAEPE